MEKKERKDYAMHKTIALLAIAKGKTTWKAISEETSITKRATYDLLKDLEGSGMIKAERTSPLNPHNTKPISYTISDIGIVFQHVFKTRFNNDRDMVKEIMLSNTYKSHVTNLIRDNIAYLVEANEFWAPWRPDLELANLLREAYQESVATGQKPFGELDPDPGWLTALVIYESGKFVDALTKLVLGFPASANLFFSQFYGWRKYLMETPNTPISLDDAPSDDSPIGILHNMIRIMDPADAIVQKEYLLAYLLS